MSVDNAADTGVRGLPDAITEPRTGPKPAAHGASVVQVYNDTDLSLGFNVDAGDTTRETTIYDAVLGYWRAHVADRDLEPWIITELDSDAYEWLPEPRYDRDLVVVLTSSRWKAGRGDGNDYRAYYDYHLKLREIDDDGELHKPPLSIHLEIMPQYADLVYQDGNPLETPYGEGTRVVTQTTWAESSDEIEARTLDVLEAVVGADRDRLELARNADSRRIAKAEAHVRFDVDKKRQVIETVEQTKSLIAYGGGTEIEARQTRYKEGWLEAVVDADRWDLLGFEDTPYNVELKVYQTSNWTDLSPAEPQHHPKIESSFAGVNGNAALPHVDDWDDVLANLRAVVSSHLDWSAVGRADLIQDDYQAGPHVEDYTYQYPSNRRDQLRERYENVSTEIYREATKANTRAVYDVLKVVSEENGASYDVLERRTGLARSTVRYHVRRLTERGVLDRVVGAEAIAVYPSLDVLDRASEILRSIYAGDTLDDMNDRADERRRRREDRDDPTPPTSTDEDDVDDVDQDDQDDQDDLVNPDQLSDVDENDDAEAEAPTPRTRSTWRYFGALDLQPHQLANALERGYLDDDEVRVRVDRRDWIG